MKNILALVLMPTLLLACSDTRDPLSGPAPLPAPTLVGSAPETTRISLVEAAGWDYQTKGRDVFLEHRPRNIECDRDEGWLVEDDAIEIRTDACNYLSITQESLLNIPAGNQVEFALSHSDLVFSESANAHVALSIAGITIWEQDIPIPAAATIYREQIDLDFAIAQRDAIELHLHNHGSNAWTIHSLEAIVSGDFDPDEFCPSYDSTFAAIQATVFETYGCTNSQCHSAAAASGGLDLSQEVAYTNLIDVPATSSELLRVTPRKPTESYLYQKLAAKTQPGSFAIAGSPMPSGVDAISSGQLEAIRLWIEAGAPQEGSAGDTLGRGEDEIERLLGVCLPEPAAVNVPPLVPPALAEGLQFAMPAHAAPAEKEREICFAVYEDFREQIPAHYMNESASLFYAHGDEVREDPFTHHHVLFYAGIPVEQIHDESFGAWTCAGGEQAGESCEPTDTQSCGASGRCRSEIRDSIACQGFGPGSGRINPVDGVNLFSVGGGPEAEGFYEEIPTHGIFYWNSHAFNLTTEDAMHHVWRNVYFADDRRYKAERVTDSRHIFAGAGTPPFSKQEVCREHVLEQGDALLSLTSHTHKRGELFTIALKGQEEDPFYINKSYDEPPLLRFDPPWEFNEADSDSRTLVYCAVYNNGLNVDGSPNLDTVTRLSRKPSRSFCRPTACVAGNIGAACNGAEDGASCDSEPGAGDGVCDACPISAGVTSDDEMFVLQAIKASNFAAQLIDPTPGLMITRPRPGAIFQPGDTFSVSLDLRHFELVPPLPHHTAVDPADPLGSGHSMGDGHNMGAGDHSTVREGHFHIYLDTEDNAAAHVTDWTPILDYTLPEDIEAGSHYLRVTLQAPDHHPIGIEARVEFTVQ